MGRHTASDYMELLLVEDNPADARLVRESLSEVPAGQIDVTATDRLSEAAGSLRTGQYDVVLLDLGLPDAQGLEALRALAKEATRVPIIVLTGNEDEEVALQALAEGAADFLVKGAFDGPDLARAVRYAVERKRAESALQLSRELLERVNQHDDVAALFDATLGCVRQWTGCQAVGIRLTEPDGTLPFCAAVGYPTELLAVENRRSLHRDQGCRCVDVMRQALEAHGDEVTPGGSLVRLVGDGTGEPPALGEPRRDAAGRETCQTCQRYGYQTVAVIPILAGTRTLGVLHVADPAAGRLQRPMLRALESTVSALGAAIRRLQEQQRIRNQEERYRALVQELSSVVLSLDAERRLVEPQPAWERYTGQAFSQARGAGWLEAIHPEDREPLRGLGASPAGEGVSFTAEGRVHHAASGQHRLCELVGVPRADETGRVREWIVALSDVHERQHAYEQRQELEAQLRQAQRMESVGRLAGGVAHDFNNLLTIIQGNAYLMSGAVLEEGSFVEELKGIQDATRKASSLTRQLLAFSRRQVLKPELVDLNQVVAETEKMLRRLIGEDVTLVSRCAERLNMVRADPGQIEQVLFNLAVNARDAMPDGGRLTIETGNVDLPERFAKAQLVGSPGRHVMLSLSDTGCGMDAATQAQIFDPFFTTKEEGKGTGLGLSTVYGIVKQSGGHIFVQSAPGEGTTFKIYLPRAKSQRKSSGRIPRPGTAQLSGDETVLLVEDEEELRRLVARILTSYGYRVLVAENGEEALRLAQQTQETIHLVLSDVIMPDLYGPEVARRIRALRPDVRVLHMSGYTDNAVVLQGVLDEGLPYLQKPFTPSALAARVREVLDDKD
jgi:PAS domain S-box-containing protein